MATYIYKFLDDTTVEIEQPLGAEAFAELEHPETGKWEEVRRIPSIPGVSFKGSGFYKTDKGK